MHVSISEKSELFLMAYTKVFTSIQYKSYTIFHTLHHFPLYPLLMNYTYIN